MYKKGIELYPLLLFLWYYNIMDSKINWKELLVPNPNSMCCKMIIISNILLVHIQHTHFLQRTLAILFCYAKRVKCCLAQSWICITVILSTVSIEITIIWKLLSTLSQNAFSKIPREMEIMRIGKILSQGSVCCVYILKIWEQGLSLLRLVPSINKSQYNNTFQ